MKKYPINQAVIYCRSASQPQSRYDLVIARQEDDCKAYAKKHGIKILEIFHDSCTTKSPAERSGFRGMCDYIRNIDQQVLVLVEGFFSLSRKPEEITEAFKLVSQACGSEIVDIPEIDEDVTLRRLKSEASREQLLIDIMQFMQETHEQTAKFWDRICDATEAGEQIL